MEKKNEFQIRQVKQENFGSFDTVYVSCDSTTAIELMKVIAEKIQQLKEEYLKKQTPQP